MKKKLLAGIMALALCSTSIPQMIFAEKSFEFVFFSIIVPEESPPAPLSLYLRIISIITLLLRNYKCFLLDKKPIRCTFQRNMSWRAGGRTRGMHIGILVFAVSYRFLRKMTGSECTEQYFRNNRFSLFNIVRREFENTP